MKGFATLRSNILSPNNNILVPLSLRPEELKFLVLDEADELLVDIFYSQMRWILDHSNPSKQMIVTTATVPPNVQFVIDRYMKFHEYIDLAEGVSHFVIRSQCSMCEICRCNLKLDFELKYKNIQSLRFVNQGVTTDKPLKER